MLQVISWIHKADWVHNAWLNMYLPCCSSLDHICWVTCQLYLLAEHSLIMELSPGDLMPCCLQLSNCNFEFHNPLLYKKNKNLLSILKIKKNKKILISIKVIKISLILFDLYGIWNSTLPKSCDSFHTGWSQSRCAPNFFSCVVV